MLIALDAVVAALPAAIAVSALTLAELAGGPACARDDLERMRRRQHLIEIESTVPAIPFDSTCAHAFGRICAIVVSVGRKPRGTRSVDLMIAATALAYGLPLYTLNASDLRGLDELIEIVDLG